MNEKKNGILRGKLLLVFLLFCATVLFTGGKMVLAADLPEVDAYAYVVMDANNGEVLFEKNSDKKIYPASVTKLMTAVVALESENAGKSYTASKALLSKVPSVASKAGAKAGVTYTFDDMQKMLLLPSGADGAYLLAYSSYGSMNRFVKKMNQKAKEIGMRYTEYDNPIGLDISDGYHHLSGTAMDYAVLTRYSMGKKEIRTNVSLAKAVLTDGTVVQNTNRFYSEYGRKKNGYEIIGAKTGSTDDAGLCLSAVARDEEGHEVICAYFKGRTNDGLYGGITALFDYTFGQYKKGKISLLAGAWDCRFRESEEIINDYVKQGLIKLSRSGAFYPEKEVTQKQLAALLTRTTKEGMKFKAEKPAKPATLCDYAKLVSSTAIMGVSEKKVNVVKKQESKRELTQEEINALTSVYSEGLVPASLGYDYDRKLTREDIVMLSSSYSIYSSALGD